ncbi:MULTISPECIES: NtaA/DmoA family FMN-dependent monooxygenase [unclassified Corynebacterium]|uniref:NtaA/DmoA family FMN-dependent monooxygenase n=1 Tax=unclassified Corynebacterium TaxID=2624378 RepID=UPI0029CA0DCD|nr:MULTISPECIES: NtaA/DmoA family FMN-dependent monooxygenase [unclassified Corynebacterium]WPF65679.1 NtaA/DmoA family FMN-dependent monooxygenase [Corynebacterium sp. 22KM0430]WPF68175.1 NtaA/DmoA family FMN-dependent monooxygenase [Corynebacterium sp. 21KM1197]
MTQNFMALGLGAGEFYGVHPGAWRSEGVDPKAYLDIQAQITYAQQAESGGFDFLFMQDRVFLHQGFPTAASMFPLDPLVQLSAIAAATSKIGLIGSASTSFSEPYTLARQFRALDLISKGRAGWNVVPSFEPEAFANHGRPVPAKAEKYERLNEVVQISQALWGSWKPEAGDPDPVTGIFMNDEHIQPINMQGRHVGSRGPLQIPPSPQGQPVLVMPAASRSGIQPAGMYAGGIIAMPSTIEEGRQQRELFRTAAEQAGRNADEVKLMSFFTFGLGATRREALDRRRELERYTDLPQRLNQLSILLGIPLTEAQADTPLSLTQVHQLRVHPRAPRSAQAVALAKEGFSPLDIIAHGVLDMSPGVVGTAEDAADYLQEWFEAGATDGAVLVADRLSDNLGDFVEQVVPILRKRGLRPDDYVGSTLRENLGLPYELGIDPRIIGRQ